MRTPIPSFESELAAFLADQRTPKKRTVRGPDMTTHTVMAAGPTNYRQLLARWLSDNRAEEIWRKVNARAPALAPRDFIRAVLSAYRSAFGSVNREFGVPGVPGIHGGEFGFRNDWPVLLKEVKGRTRRAMAGSPLDVSPVELAAVLEEAASDIRALHFLYLDCSDQVRFRLGRQGPNEDRMRKAFEQIMSDYFQKHCRAKLRSEIGALTEIAFPGKEVNPDHVRDAMRSRPRKRRKRQRSR